MPLCSLSPSYGCYTSQAFVNVNTRSPRTPMVYRIISGTLSVMGKEAALAAYVAGNGTAASKFAGRIGLYGLTLSSAVDFGETVYDYHACRTGN